MKQWYVVGRDPEGEQKAYICEGDTPDEAKEDFAESFPELQFVNIF